MQRRDGKEGSPCKVLLQTDLKSNANAYGDIVRSPRCPPTCLCPKQCNPWLLPPFPFKHKDSRLPDHPSTTHVSGSTL